MYKSTTCSKSKQHLSKAALLSQPSHAKRRKKIPIPISPMQRLSNVQTLQPNIQPILQLLLLSHPAPQTIIPYPKYHRNPPPPTGASLSNNPSLTLRLHVNVSLSPYPSACREDDIRNIGAHRHTSASRPPGYKVQASYVYGVHTCMAAPAWRGREGFWNGGRAMSWCGVKERREGEVE
ncbi:hypothetical protein BDU57DRAFT_518122 [Ampelomyces quisqualis]|uniref:Uncharacterized protein n=1 Tax=Ampelomyces quisqualis TaxID=50730 RepID=A0A6A5QLA3_AMPQU|nr:hypothetical protein BDU57DRAFT_518122 [Ampelomyces quisqualis]